MPSPQSQPIKPLTIALICAAAVAMMFVGSIVIGVAIVQAERAAPTTNASSE
jgi:hypothetical protein